MAAQRPPVYKSTVRARKGFFDREVREWTVEDGWDWQPKKEVDLGPFHVAKEEKHTVLLPPVLGGLALIGGIIVMLTEGHGKYK